MRIGAEENKSFSLLKAASAPGLQEKGLAVEESWVSVGSNPAVVPDEPPIEVGKVQEL